jgi:hypothetical protein
MRRTGKNAYLVNFPLLSLNCSAYCFSVNVEILELMTEFPIDFRNRTLYAEKQ